MRFPFNFLSLFGIFLILVLSTGCQAQPDSPPFNFQNFEKKVLNYTAVQKQGISERDFALAQRILSETKSAVKGKPENFNVADYWNLAVAFMKLREDTALVSIAFQKAIEDSPESLCAYINSMGSGGLENYLSDQFFSFYNGCDQYAEEEETDWTAYAQKGKYDLQLVLLMNQINEDDGKYRREENIDWNKQKVLDIRNQELVDSLYQQHGQYVGRKMVGNKLESAMWAVIQHSNLEMMERYLPIIHKAVQAKDLQVVPLKMLLDRIYWLKHKYQIFGSQGGVPVAPESKVNEVKQQYQLE